MSFGTIFWDDTAIFWDENLLGFLTKKKNCFGPIRSLFTLFSSQNVVISSLKIMAQNIILKDMNKSLVLK